jgi:glycosyltransferase involved in cell wall biosynthesis
MKIDRAVSKVSVVMPAFNAGRTIERAILSISGQTVKPRELIVVDDGSSDDTVAVVTACRGKMGAVQLRLYRQAHLGPGTARNQAIRVATGEYLAFLDADDEWLPEKLERSLQVMAADALTMVAHDIFEISKTGTHRVDCLSRWLADPQHPMHTLYLRGYISSSTVVVRRQDVLAVSGFDVTLPSAQDYDLWLALLSLPTTRFALFGDALLRYYLTDTGITGRTEMRRRCSERIMRAHIRGLRGGAVDTLTRVALRATIVQVEAIRAYRARGALGSAVRCLLLTPWTILRAIAAIPFSRPQPRNFLASLPSATEVL